MADSKADIKKFIRSLSEENYAQAYDHLGKILYDKTKKRCSDEYERIKNSSANK